MRSFIFEALRVLITHLLVTSCLVDAAIYRNRRNVGEDEQNMQVSDGQQQAFAPVNQQLYRYQRSTLNCTSGCSDVELTRQIRLAKLKKMVLDKLGLNKDSLPQSVPDHIKDLTANTPWAKHAKGQIENGQPVSHTMVSDAPYDAELDHGNENSIKTETVYAFATKPNRELDHADMLNKSIAVFRFSENTLQYDVGEAKLIFHARPVTSVLEQDKHKVVLTVRINRVVNDHRKGIIAKELIVKDFTVTNLGHMRGAKKFEFPVTDLARGWFEDSNENLGIQVELMYNGENLAIQPGQEDYLDKNIYMRLQLKDSSRRRFRRDTNSRTIPNCNINEPAEDRECCRDALIVDFEEFRWDWIIAPKRYKAYLCSGKCPSYHYAQDIHSHLQVQAGAPRCCTATATTHIDLIYMSTEMEVTVTKVPGMVVTDCGCA